jgi:uncharacterized protein (DUF58 family)
MSASTPSGIAIPPHWEAALKRWLNFHRVLWALTAVSFFIAWNRGLALLYGLFSLLIALLLVSYLMPGRQLRNIRVVRRCKGDFTAGRSGRITYQLAAGGTRYHVELEDSLEFAETPEQRFFFNKLAGQSSCTLQFRCLHRGCFRLGDLGLTSAYPFGIVTFSKRIAVERIEILVFPRLFDLSRLPAPLVADATTRGDLYLPQKGGRDEYTTVREYSRGDELNRIHWPVSARHQHLMVREYEKTDRPAVLIVLDCNKKFNVGRAPATTFEFAVSIAASMIRFATQQGIPCFLAARSGHWRELAVHPPGTDLYALYELLARLNADGRRPYHRVVARALRQFPQTSLITTFRLDSDPALPEIGPRATHVDLVMHAQSFRSSHEPAADNGPLRRGNRWTYWVYANREPENLFQ